MRLTDYQGFVGPANVERSIIADGELTINMFVHILQYGAKAQSVLYQVPGLNTFFEVAQGPVRATFAQDGRAFAVIGYKFYEFFADGTTTDRGDVALDANPATISSNGLGANELFITTGNEGYIFDLITDALSHVVSDVTSGGFVDGYFVAFDVATSTFKISDLEDGTTWNPGQAVQRNTAGDKWVGMVVKNREVWLNGSQTTDVYVNTGANPFPFEPVPQVLIQHGSAAGFSAVTVGDVVIWLQANAQGQGMVMRSEGYGAVKISTPAVDREIQSYGTISDAVGYAYEDQGHTFYVLNFITADETWMFDLTTGLWSKRLFWNTTLGRWQAHRGICHCLAFDKHFIGDRATGKMYQQAEAFYVDADDAPLVRLRRAPHIASRGQMLFIALFQIDMTVGVGSANGQGANPQLMLRFSRDGGQTWGQPRWVSAGRIGRYLTRAIWRRFGRSRDAVFEVQVSDPVQVAFNQVWIGLEKEAA